MARKTIIRLTESDIHNMVLEAVKEAVKQQFGSSATSINKTKTARSECTNCSVTTFDYI